MDYNSSQHHPLKTAIRLSSRHWAQGMPLHRGLPRPQARDSSYRSLRYRL